MQVRTARSWAIFCMGLWLMGVVLTAVVASQNFYTIYRLLDAQPNPAFSAAVQKLGAAAAQDFLRYLSSELNRLYFQWWNIAQLAIGILTLWLVVKVPAAARPKWVIVAMLAIVLFLTVFITPRIVSVGRDLDFVPRDPAPAGMREFGLLHATYTVFDGVELILGVLATLWLTKLKD